MSSFFFTSPLTDLAVIDISGADAASFLHGQLTHDITGLTRDRAHLAGYCTAKGRLLGTMVIWQMPDAETPAFRALIKADIADAVAKRLSMFVLRAKVTLSVSRPLILGADLKGPNGNELAKRKGPESATVDPALVASAADLPSAPAPWTVVHSSVGVWIAAPGTQANGTRWWLITPEPASERSAAASKDMAFWQGGDIAAGLPWVESATQDVFIPQTLNLDLIDGVSFTKGCYPGQEVVARSHYRGTVKRRMAYGVIQDATNVDVAALPGTDTYDALKPDNPCGRIVNAAAAGPDGPASGTAGLVHVLMEVQLADLETADFRLHGPDGPAIALRALPYEILTSSPS